MRGCILAQLYFYPFSPLIRKSSALLWFNFMKDQNYDEEAMKNV